MRNKLPILLALLLMTAAAAPWLRSLESQRWGASDPTTVPPPNPVPLPPGAAPSPRSTAPGPAATAIDNGSGSSNDGTLPPQSAAIIPSRATPADSSQSDIPQLPQVKPQTLLDDAVLAVENQPRISAQLSEEGGMFGRPMVGVGRYYEARQGPIPMIHLEMTLQVDSIATSLMQVCNGTTLWTYRKLPVGESLNKLDAVRAITALEQAAGRLPPGQMMASPDLGGLGRLMRGLNSQFDFAAAVGGELDGMPVWKLGGVWKPEVLARLLPGQKAAAEKGKPYDTSRLPGHLPDGATVYLRQSDYFPLRIDYTRGAKSPRCLVSLKFDDVNFNAPIDSSEFLFTPGSLDYGDRTDDFVRSLGEDR